MRSEGRGHLTAPGGGIGADGPKTYPHSLSEQGGGKGFVVAAPQGRYTETQ